MIIGLIGRAGSGKDTVADFLVNNHDFTKLSFGKILKDVISIIFGWDRELLEGDTLESREFRETIDEWWSKELGFSVTPRKMFQMIGTDVMRKHFNQDIWVLVLKKKLNDYSIKNKNIIITDIRFINEYNMVSEIGGKMIKIIRTNMHTYNHSSENNIDNFKSDFIINNNSSIENLYNKVRTIMNLVCNNSFIDE